MLLTDLEIIINKLDEVNENKKRHDEMLKFIITNSPMKYNARGNYINVFFERGAPMKLITIPENDDLFEFALQEIEKRR